MEWIFGREKDFIWTICSSFLLLIINNSRVSSAFNNGL
ncbi:transposase [Escherichia coli MP1]|nr:transposase [Escherichia coli]EWY53795.1 transposase [Escherichia coli MP1]